MEILNKIKKLFANKQESTKEPEKKIVNEKDIDRLLKENKEKIESLFKEKIENLQSELLSILDNLEENTKLLSKVDLSKRKVEEKLKQITELGREEYIAHIYKLLKKLKEKQAPEQLSSYIGSEINKFIDSTAKSHFKATQLIGKEMENITNDIIKIKELIKNFTRNNSRLIEDNNNIKSLLIKNEDRKKNEKIKESIIAEISLIENNKKESEKALERIEKQIQEIKGSLLFREKEKLLNEKSEKENALKEIELKTNNLIDRRILEKYVYIEKNRENKKIAQNYIENPAISIISDNELKILGIFQNIKEKINNKTIILKEPNKTMEKITIGKDDLLYHKNMLLSLNEEIKKLEGEITKIKININSTITEKIKIENELAENTNRISTLNKKYDKINKSIFDINSYLTLEISKL